MAKTSVRIRCLTPFLDGTERFEKDEIRVIDQERAVLFLAHGWAEKFGEVQAAGDESAGTAECGVETDLQVQNVTLNSGDNHG